MEMATLAERIVLNDRGERKKCKRTTPCFQELQQWYTEDYLIKMVESELMRVPKDRHGSLRPHMTTDVFPRWLMAKENNQISFTLKNSTASNPFKICNCCFLSMYGVSDEGIRKWRNNFYGLKV